MGNKTFAQDDADEELNAADGDRNGAEGPIEDDLGVGDEPESSDLLLLDPKDWKVSSKMTCDAAISAQSFHRIKIITKFLDYQSSGSMPLWIKFALRVSISNDATIKSSDHIHRS